MTLLSAARALIYFADEWFIDTSAPELQGRCAAPDVSVIWCTPSDRPGYA
jgi:hypothetical protein